MTETRREPVSGNHLVYAPRFGIELMNECDHAVVTAELTPTTALATAADAEIPCSCVRCPRCSRTVTVRFWRPASGGWYLRLRDSFAAGRMSIFRYTGHGWATDG